MIELKLTNISCGYGKRKIVDNLSCVIHSNKITGILGPNGSGKTTLFKAILRLLKLEGGTIELDNRDISSFSAKEYARQVAYVAQSSGDIFDFTVEELLLMGRYSYAGLAQKTADQTVLERVIRDMDCLELRHRLCHELSGGELQRVMIARALMQQPDFLLLDEPTSSLDLAAINSLIGILRELLDRTGNGCIIVSHDINFLAEISDELILFNEGNIVATGAPADVLTELNMVKMFGPAIMRPSKLSVSLYDYFRQSGDSRPGIL